LGYLARSRAGKIDSVLISIFSSNPPEGADLSDLMHLEQAFSAILGRNVDLVSYGGLDPEVDQDVLDDTVLL
jgi:predicted nucleotidyltransferase